MYRNVVFVVLLMLARPCFLSHKTVLNKCAISIRGKFNMKIWPKYILRKRIHRFIQSTQILLPSTAQGSEVWENTDQNTVRPFLENAPELPGEDVEASIGVEVRASTITSESSEYKTFFYYLI